jgi:ABC-type lipoprotein export system ATPase subunit
MTDMSNVIIKGENLSKTYKTVVDEVKVFGNLDIEIYRGEAIAIMGKSGGGKTTLLNILSGLDRPTTGNVMFDNKRIDNMDETSLSVFRNRNVGFIFQHHYLLEDFTAIENLLIPLRIAEAEMGTTAYKKAFALLKAVGVNKRAFHYPDQLSGGERQRVAVGRALINNPQVVFADEPTGSLDRKNAAIVEDLLWELKDKFNKTLVIATHSLEIAEKCDKVINMDEQG